MNNKIYSTIVYIHITDEASGISLP